MGINIYIPNYNFALSDGFESPVNTVLSDADNQNQMLSRHDLVKYKLAQDLSFTFGMNIYNFSE